MGIDAVALIRPRSRALLAACLERAEAPPGSVRPLDDGAALLTTFVRFPREGQQATELRVMLSEVFGDELADLHDDPRGLFVFPDVCEPQGRSYDAVLAELEGAGIWLPTEPMAEAEIEAWRTKITTHVQHLLALSTHGTPLPPEMAGVERLLREQAARMADDPEQGDDPALDPAALLRGATETLGVGSFDELLQKTAAVAEGLIAGCFLVRGPGPAAADPDLNTTAALADGSSVLVTTRLGRELDVFALELGAHPGWTAGHDDVRGVLVFDRAHLAEVLACVGYDGAIAALGDRGTWIRPKTIDDLLAEADARGRAYLDGDD